MARDWRSADLPDRTRAILGYAEKLTRRPEAVEASDVEALRAAGLSEEAVLHLCEVVSYFNLVNRIADGLGVSLESGWSEPIIRYSDDSG